MQLTPAHIGIVISDLDASTAFYRALGFEISADHPWDDGSRAIRFMKLDDFEIELFWYAETPPAPPVAEGKQLGFRHFALATDDVDATLAELKSAGIVPADIEARTVGLGYRIAFIYDPDGIEIELSQAL
ncbi:MAG TPA: VOC family protein [Coriobacteriia bacterium]|nr:VOC family protein [Coriobacteriia bacterium]